MIKALTVMVKAFLWLTKLLRGKPNSLGDNLGEK